LKIYIREDNRNPLGKGKLRYDLEKFKFKSTITRTSEENHDL